MQTNWLPAANRLTHETLCYEFSMIQTCRRGLPKLWAYHKEMCNDRIAAPNHTTFEHGRKDLTLSKREPYDKVHVNQQQC